MYRRRLGRTGLEVSAIGAGTYGLAAYRGVDPGDVRRALCHAVDRGIDLLDVVGGVDVERLVGDVVRELRARDRAVVVAKVPPAGEDRPRRGDRLHRVFPGGWVQESVERSLRATRLEVLPVCLFHLWFDDWLDDAAWPELRGTLERLIREGKVLHWGVAVAEDVAPDDAVRALAEPVIAVVSVEHNLFDRRAEAALLPAAHAHAAGVIVRAALDHGALGGELGATARFHAEDWRAGYFTGDRLAEIAVRLARLAEHVAEPAPAAASTDPAREALAAAIAKRRGTAVEARTVAELALRFVLARPEVHAAVVGMRTRAHVDANLTIADGRTLSAGLIERLVESREPVGATPPLDLRSTSA